MLMALSKAWPSFVRGKLMILGEAVTQISKLLKVTYYLVKVTHIHAAKTALCSCFAFLFFFFLQVEALSHSKQPKLLTLSFFEGHVQINKIKTQS